MTLSAPSRAPCRAAAAAGVALALLLAGCGAAGDRHGRILAVGAESQYADVIAQVGGDAVEVSSILDNPSVDPHSFEVSPSVAAAISSAQLAVQNGLGYDTFMNRIEEAAPNSARRVIVVQHLLGLTGSTPNPHLWYGAETMLDVAARVDADLSALRPRLSAYFHANEVRFDHSLGPWFRALARLRHRYPGAAVASTEPVADLLLTAAGLRNLTPLSFQLDVMNGVDPAPQAISFEDGLIDRHRVRALVYNRQVTDSLTANIRQDARVAGVPVVGVDETMPPRMSYGRWMLQTTLALERALEGAG
jgi:zinc/manganese transport system substrate-binding protein